MKNQLPPKWCIRRTPRNYQQVNQIISSIYGKEYKGRGKSLYYECDYVHYPPVKTRRYSKGRVVIPWANHQEITLQDVETAQIKTEMKKDYTKNWYIVVTEENRKKLSEWIDFSDNYQIPLGGIVGMAYQEYRRPDTYNKFWNEYKIIKDEYYDFGEEISYDEFRFHILKEYTRQDWLDGRIAIRRPSQKDPLLDSFLRECNNKSNPLHPSPSLCYLISVTDERGSGVWNAVSKTDLPVIEDIKEIYKNEKMNTKTLIGYIAKNKEFQQAIVELNPITQTDIARNIASHGFAFSLNWYGIKKLKDLGVLDIWCDPVYEKPKPKLPVINTYNGEDKGDYLQYGCAKISKEWFKDSENRHIVALTLNTNVTLHSEDIKAIRKYLKYE